jgi:hypothetical protein
MNALLNIAPLEDPQHERQPEHEHPAEHRD